ncbi:MAG: hypothetical protein SVZ03_15745 [Spirochaetota bacterium]|nr:hypothetical protein [Spirochaetota bacterium]
MNISTNIIEGKKTFFLYPHIPQGKHIIKYLIKNEYEAYPLNNHLSAINLFDEFSNSILYVNIDFKLNHHDWMLYIESILENPTTDTIIAGVITTNGNDEFLQTDLSNLNIPGGYICIDNGLDKCTNSIINILNSQNARGRRKYLRVKCKNIYKALFSIKLGKDLFQGRVVDISSAGMLCMFNHNIELSSGIYLNDILLNLKGYISKVAGQIAGERKIDGNDLYVIMFDYRKTYKERDKIHDFIYNILEQQMSAKIKEIEISV